MFKNLKIWCPRKDMVKEDVGSKVQKVDREAQRMVESRQLSECNLDHALACVGLPPCPDVYIGTFPSSSRKKFCIIVGDITALSF